MREKLKSYHEVWQLTRQLLIVTKLGRCVYESVLQEKKQTPIVSVGDRQHCQVAIALIQISFGSGNIL